jgi:hypothetical protein
MSLNSSASAKSFAMSLIDAIGSQYSYSRKRRDGLDAWQEHIRKSATTVGIAFLPRRDRELRRVVVPG